MTDFIAAYDAEINAALDEQGKAFAAARERFTERERAAEIALIAAMTHRGRMYVEGPPPVEQEAQETNGNGYQLTIPTREIAPPSDEAVDD